MSTPKIKLLNTVKALNEQGVTDLTASEKAQIEKETQDLIKNSKKKRAMKAPEGFDEVVEALGGVDADEAFKIVTDFLKDKGLLESHDGAEEKADEVSDKIEDVLDKADGKEEVEDKFEKKDEDKDEEKVEDKFEKMDNGLGKGLDKEDREDKEEGFDKEVPLEEKIDLGKEDGPKGLGLGLCKDKKVEIKEDLMKDLSDTKSLREKIIAQALELSSEEKKKRLKDLQDDEKSSEEDMPAMGMEAGLKVIVTANKNILVAQGGKPLFHAVIRDDIKNDLNKLARLANRVSGWLVSEGVEKTAKRCKANMIAGVDEGINFGGQELPEADKGVSDGGETVGDESNEGNLPDSSQEDAQFTSKEKPDAKVARYEVVGETVSDISEGGEDEIKEERPARGTSVTDKAVDEIKDARPEGSDNSQEGAMTQIRDLEANYKKLYAGKARKMAEKAQGDFAKKFSRCLSIASERMLKNLCYNPMKSAAADVLMSTNIQFSNGDRYAGMDEAAAVELTELISAEGHGRFLEALLQYTADLMEKEDLYLKDVESDLKNLAPVPVEVTAARKSSNESLRDDVIEGSVAIQAKRASTGPQNSSANGVVSSALSGTRIGRRLSRKF